MRWQRCAMEVVKQVPIDDRVEGWAFWRGEAHVTLLRKNRLKFPAEHQRGNVGNGEGGMVDGWMWSNQWVGHVPHPLLGSLGRSALRSGHGRVGSVVSDATSEAGDRSPLAENTFGVQV